MTIMIGFMVRGQHLSKFPAKNTTAKLQQSQRLVNRGDLGLDIPRYDSRLDMDVTDLIVDFTCRSIT